MLIQGDDFAGSVAISCNPPSDTNFRLGNHTVTCRAVDAAGNRGTASFIISVISATTSPPLGGSSSSVGGITISDLHIDFLTASGPVASDTNAYNGPCPVGASISGRITDNVGNRDVTYRLIMNDGVLPEGVRHFDQPGSEIVSFGIQTLGGFNNVQSYQGWFAIEILQPVQLQSERVEFQTTCTPSTGGTPPAAQTLQAENDTTTAGTTTDDEEEQDTTQLMEQEQEATLAVVTTMAEQQRTVEQETLLAVVAAAQTMTPNPSNSESRVVEEHN
jgi:HYR domain